MQRRHDLCAFADGCSDAFDGSRANVTDGEDTAPARLQGMPLAAGIFAGQHEPFAVERNATAGKPIGIRVGADEQEQMANRSPHFFSGGAETPANLIQYAVAAFKTADS